MSQIQVAIFVCLLFIFPAIGLGQSFQKGHIVKLDGDTLTGEMYLQLGKAAEEQVWFRTAPKEDIGIFTFDDISAFEMDGMIFRAANLHVTLKSGEIVQYRKFAELLFAGEYSLYQYKHRGNRKVFYLQKNQGDLMELVNTGDKDQFVEERAKTLRIEDRRYMELLKEHLGDCAQVIHKMNTIHKLYTEDGLKILLTDWHNCTDNEYGYQRDKGNGMHIRRHRWLLSTTLLVGAPLESGGTRPMAFGFEVGSEIRAKGFSKWGLHLGVEALDQSGPYDLGSVGNTRSLGFLVLPKRIIPVKKGEYYVKVGLAGSATRAFDQISNRQRLQVIPIPQTSVGYEQGPFFLEGRVFFFRPIEQFYYGIKGGLRL